MTCVYVWHLGAVFSLLAVPGEQRAQPLAVPQILRVYSEEDKGDFGVWEMNIEWRDKFTNTSQPQKATYELRIFHTEYRRLVHNETVEVIPDLTGVYHWSWTSPIPLQCTSHSVQLRLREHHKTSEWSNEYILEGNDTKDEDKIYPGNRKVLVNEGIVFCCILKSYKVKGFRSSQFTIQISNRTFITEPVRNPHRTKPSGDDIVCDDEGATYYTGYPPDVHNLTCETRDLSSVECCWSRGLKHGFVGDNGDMRYSINGRACSSEKCVLEQSVDKAVTNWTLTAKNILGEKTLTDVADPKHRVRLKAPDQAHASAVGERTAELEWIWEEINYRTFPMTCQVQLNGLMVNETFNGTGLHSASLKDLQTSTTYKAQVRCGAQEHFYTWGDWSDIIIFRTKPDSSKAADVWMQVLGGQTSVVWKPFSSDYKISSFELLLGNSTKPVTKPPNEFCYKVDSESTETHSVISVSAKGSEWTSPPSSITLPNLSEGGVNISAINASNGGFYLNWEPNPVSTCGYVVDWYPTYRAEPCAIEWIKVSSRVYSTHIHSDFKEGVSYTLSVYACTSGAPKLLQRREGYVKELAPSGVVQNLKAKQMDSVVYLSWNDVLKVEQRGFIQGYNVSYSSRNVNKWKVIQDPSTREHKFSLHPDYYRFTVTPLTSAGEGPMTSVTLAMNPPTEKIIIIMLCVLAAATCTLAILYRKKNWLKSVLYPDIPKPGLSEEWHSKGFHQCQLIDKLLMAERDVLKICYPEPSSQRMADLQKEDEEAQLLYSPGSQDSPLPETWEMIPEHQILNLITYSTPVIPINPVTPIPYSNPVTPVPPVTYANPVTPVTYATPVTPITVDFSYMEVPCAAVQNPTYNIPVEHLPVRPLATDIVATPGYIPQKQNRTAVTVPIDLFCQEKNLRPADNQ